MIECPVCHKKVSEFSLVCPNCHSRFIKEQGKVSATKSKDTDEIVNKLNKSKIVPLIVNFAVAFVLMFMITAITSIPIPSPTMLLGILLFKLLFYVAFIVVSCINIKINSFRLPKRKIIIGVVAITTIVWCAYFILSRINLFGRNAIAYFMYYPAGVQLLFVLELFLHAIALIVLVLEACMIIQYVQKKEV